MQYGSVVKLRIIGNLSKQAITSRRRIFSSKMATFQLDTGRLLKNDLQAILFLRLMCAKLWKDFSTYADWHSMPAIPLSRYDQIVEAFVELLEPGDDASKYIGLAVHWPESANDVFSTSPASDLNRETLLKKISEIIPTHFPPEHDFPSPSDDDYDFHHKLMRVSLASEVFETGWTAPTSESLTFPVYEGCRAIFGCQGPVLAASEDEILPW